MDSPFRQTATGKLVLAEYTLMDAYNATQNSAPSHQFGTASRSELAEAEETPGAGAYKIKTTLLGKVPNSKIHSTPQYSLRGREKFGSPNIRALDPTTQKEPGPGWYQPRQVNPLYDNPPQHSFPKGRWIKDKARLSPGPGAYVIPSAVGKQVLSTKSNHSSVGFGTGHRPSLLRVNNDVGPGEYGAGVSACRAQVDSRKKTAAFVKFGTGARNKDASDFEKDEAESRPGPGTYKLPAALGGEGASYPFRAAPKARLAGREKFGSPFANWN